MPHRRWLPLIVSAVVAVGLLGVTPGSSPVPVTTVRAAAAAPAPEASAAAPTAPNVELGRTAVNGTVRAAVLDPATGRTYIGGQFTEIGRRTGPVTVVDPPDVGDGAVTATAPEVTGEVISVFADDRPGDPGFFVVGRLTAINGASVTDRPVQRIHLVAGRWVHDASWVAGDGCHTGNAQFPRGPWLATPNYLIFGGYAGAAANGRNHTGITLFERATGDRLILGTAPCSDVEELYPSIPQLPDLAGCTYQKYCYAAVGPMAYEPSTDHLIVTYGYAVGGSTPKTWTGFAAYDLRPSSGKRAWVRFPGHGTPPIAGQQPIVHTVGAVPGAFLARGLFPMDPGAAEADMSRTLLLSATSGAILQRWDAGGEQSLETGAEIGPGNACVTGTPDFWSDLDPMSDGAVGWVDGTTLCRYRRPSGTFTPILVGTFDVESRSDVHLPGVPYTAPDGTRYLLGSEGAVDLDARVLVDWDPDPSVHTTNPQLIAVTVSAGGVILGGSFTFLRGRSSNGVAALDTAMAPISWFTSPLREPVSNEGVFALALSQGRLLVGGGYLMPGGTGSIVALDADNGSLHAWAPDPSDPVIVDDIAVGPDGDFWIGGFADIDAPGSALQHYAAIDDGGALLASPEFGCLDAPMLSGLEPSAPVCLPEWAGRARVQSLLRATDGTLYVAGVFGSIDGFERRGLARFTSAGMLAAWKPDLLDAMAIETDGGLMEMAPYSMVLLADRLVVGGLFSSVVRKADGGGGTVHGRSPLFVFSASTGDLVLPATGDGLPWIDISEPSLVAYDIAHTDDGLYVALGETGIGIFDATSFAFDAAASEAFLNPDWWARAPGSAVYVLTLSGADGTTATSTAARTAAAAEARSGRMIMAGVLSRWNLRVAGNVARAIVTSDTVRPTTTTPRVGPRSGKTVSGTTVTTQVIWSGADPGGSGVARYELAMSTSGGPFSTVSTTLLRPTADVTLTRGTSYRFRARAVDFAGNVGAWVTGPSVQVSLTQQTSTSVKYSSGWLTETGASYSGGSTRVRSLKNATATFTFTGRGVGLVATQAPTRGQAKIYVDGVHVGTIDLRASTTRYRTLVWQRSWTTSAKRTVKVVVVGTSGRPRIDVDAFVIVR